MGGAVQAVTIMDILRNILIMLVIIATVRIKIVTTEKYKQKWILKISNGKPYFRPQN